MFAVAAADTNLVLVHCDPAVASPASVVAALAVRDSVDTTVVRALAATQTEFRLAFHRDISAPQVPVLSAGHST